MASVSRLLLAVWASLGLLVAAGGVALADETHFGRGVGSGVVDETSSAVLNLFLVALLVAGLAVYLVGFGPLSETRIGQSDYLNRVRNFSRNAKLLVVRGLINGLNFGLWAVLFNLYLLAVGFDASFVAAAISINWLTHGVAVIPAGILSDMLGRRNTFLIAYSFTTVFRFARLVTVDPSLIMLFSALGGISEGFHAITGPPFMAEQSKPEERAHLFSVEAASTSISLTAGNVLAGALPLMIAPLVGFHPASGEVLRIALMFAIPLAVASMIPIFLIKENWRRISPREWFGQLQSRQVIGMMSITTMLSAVGLGLTIPFYNVFFATQFQANPEQIGLIFGLGTVAISFCTLAAAPLAQRFGRVNTIVGVQLLGLPILMSIAFAPVLWAAGGLYVLRQVFSGTAAGPGGGLAAPIYRLFSMEVVKPRERGTINGLVHAFNEFPMAFGATLAGAMIAGGQWSTVFSVAAAFMGASLVVYYWYFRRLESRMEAPAPVVAGASQ
jgi:MFS family permease